MKNSNNWRQSHSSITRRLTGVVLIPSIALLVMWTIVSSLVVYNGLYVRAVIAGVQEVSIPAVEVLSSARKERTLSLLELARPGTTRSQLEDQRTQTDTSLRAMRAAVDPLLEQSPEDIRQRMRALDNVLGGLADVRERVDSGQANKDEAYAYYNSFLDTGSRLFETQARTVPDFTAGQGGLLATELFVASDRMSRAGSLVSSGLSTRTFTTGDHIEFSRLVGTYHLALETTAEALPPKVQQQHRALVQSDSYRRLADLEGQVISHGPWSQNAQGSDEENTQTGPPPIRAEDWLNATTAVGDDMTEMVVQQANHAATVGLDNATDNLIRVVAGSALALAVVIIAIVVAARVARMIARRLYGLRDDTLDLANNRVPEIVARLRNGEKVSIESEIPSLQYGSDEIGQVAHAFNRAVTSAVQESQAREGINNVFLGIAHRSQTLVHRQLKLLDKLEREGEDPDQMEMLFQLDHLATRARRNAENLIILGGEQPGRKWNKPIKLVDILRSSVAETKHYARVRIDHIPRLSLTGAAVADTIHLIAELVDNATSFSPPHSQVTVQAQEVAKGVVVEVEDHGLGMNEEDRDRANAMLNDPPEFDAMALKADSRLGLFVIARLAVKHGVGVELRSSPYGGTRAIVLIPKRLIVTAEDPLRSESRNDLTAEIPMSRPSDDPRSGENEPSGPRAQDDDHAEPEASSSTNSDLFTFWGETADALTAGDGRDRNGGPGSTPGSEPGPSGRPRTDSREQPEVRPRGGHDRPQTNVVASTGTTAPAAEEEWPRADDWPTGEEWPANDQQAAGHDPRPALPRRRRQASLAPQLREETTFSAVADDDEDSGRSADEIRGLMSAFQDGTHKGRRQSEGPPRKRTSE